MIVKFATWNMAYGFHSNILTETWDYYLNTISADFHLFQEARPPQHILNESGHLVWDEIGGTRPWGSGIYSKSNELGKEVIDTDFSGAITIANTTIGKDKITIISLYGLMESSGPAKGYAITNLHRLLSDLTRLFNGHINGKRKIVLGGDLNASVQLDPMQRNNSHRIFFERLEDFGLIDCFKLAGKEYPIQTLRHPRSSIKWQNDYFFISDSLSKKFVECNVLDNEYVRKYSDHNPVMIAMDL
jgi:exodeoxyribonuclease-3